MHFGSLILKNLARRPMRVGLTLAAFSTAIASVVSLLGIADSFTRSFGEIYSAHSVDIIVSRQGSADRLSSSIDESFEDSISDLEGVDRAGAVLLETMSLEDQGMYGIPTMGVRPDSWILDDYEFLSQSDISVVQTDTSGTGHYLYLGTHLAERLEVTAGQLLNVFGEPYSIAGIFRSPSSWENGAIIFPLSELQQLTGRPDQATYINVVLARPLGDQAAENAQSAIEKLDARLLALPTAQFVETDTRMQLAGAMAWMTSVIALVIGSIGTLNTMLTSVMERTREIGILRAIGWPKRRVVRMILLESCGLAAGASVIGTLLALLMTWGLSQAPETKGILSPSIGWSVMGQGILLAFGIGLVGALLPAWRAAQLLPTQAFREN